MPLDPQRLLNLKIPSRDVAYTDRDVMLYALAVGCGATGSGEDLHFVYENDLAVIPSFAHMLAFDDSWLSAGGIDLRQVVHGSLDLTFHHPVAPEGTVDVASAIAGLTDKGEGKGGIILQEAVLTQGGHKICTSLSSLFVRGGGGFGGTIGKETTAVALPGGPADLEIEVRTLPNQALLFRLLGDRNPLHADPLVARESGFDRPILHGACTFGIACVTTLRSFCELDPSRLQRFAARFVGPLYPGETLVFSFWQSQNQISFRAIAKERGAAVLDSGIAVLNA